MQEITKAPVSSTETVGETHSIEQSHIKKWLHRSLWVCTISLVINLLSALVFVLAPSFDFRIMGYGVIFLGVCACVYVLALLNKSLNLASDKNLSPPSVLKYFLATFFHLGALFMFYKIYQGEVPYLSQHIQVTVTNTSYEKLSEIKIQYGSDTQVIKDLRSNEIKKLKFFKSPGVMKVILQDKAGERTAEFNIDDDNYKVLLRVDWQKNIMPNLK